MEPKFNIDRPKVTDEEINKRKDFERLVKQFKQQSLQKARNDKSWWKDKKIRYSTIIAGITVVCSISYLAISNQQKTKNNTNETLTTQLHKPIKPTTESSKKAFIAPPSKKISIPYTAYKVDNSKGADLSHSTSSKIKVPKNCFVDKNGHDIVGEVTLEYREFHDKGDIIASGIPMSYDSAGIKHNLETAGMFDIKGSQNGEPVYIKENKSLQVQLASSSSDDRFNQYYLDTIARNWQYIRHDVPVPVKQKAIARNNETTSIKAEQLKREIDVVIPKKIDSVKIVYTKKTEALPKAKEPAKPAKPSGRQTFNIDANPSEFPELASFSNLLFEVGDENKNYSKELNDITWNDVKISEGPQKGKNYLLTLRARQRTEKLIVYPVLTGTDYEKAQKKYQQKFEEYEGLVQKRENDEKKLLAEMEAKQKAYYAELEKKKAEYEKEKALALARQRSEESNELANNFENMSNSVRATRIFQVSRFGVHNSDHPHPSAGLKEMDPVFASNNKTLDPDLIYVVDHTKNTVYSYSYKEAVKYDPYSENSFVVFVKNKMFLCNKNNFKDALASGKYQVTPLPDDADNLPDFKKALEI